MIPYEMLVGEFRNVERLIKRFMQFRTGQQKSGWKSIARSRPVLGILVVLLGAFAWSVFGFTGKMEVTRENRILAEQKVALLEQEKEKLTRDINSLKTNEGVEESIREKFGLVKEGENLIVIVEDKNKPEATPAPRKSFFAPLFFWKNWFK